MVGAVGAAQLREARARGRGRCSCGVGGVRAGRPVQLRRGAGSRPVQLRRRLPGAESGGLGEGAWEPPQLQWRPGRPRLRGPVQLQRRPGGGGGGGGAPGRCGCREAPGARALGRRGSGSNHPPPPGCFLRLFFCCCRDPALFPRLLLKVFSCCTGSAPSTSFPVVEPSSFPECFVHSQLSGPAVAGREGVDLWSGSRWPVAVLGTH